MVGIKRSRTRERESMEMDIHESPAKKRVRTGTPVLVPETPKPKDMSASPHRMDVDFDGWLKSLPGAEGDTGKWDLYMLR